MRNCAFTLASILYTGAEAFWIYFARLTIWFDTFSNILVCIVLQINDLCFIYCFLYNRMIEEIKFLENERLENAVQMEREKLANVETNADNLKQVNTATKHNYSKIPMTSCICICFPIFCSNFVKDTDFSFRVYWRRRLKF